jgi:hypothetical protein
MIVPGRQPSPARTHSGDAFLSVGASDFPHAPGSALPSSDNSYSRYPCRNICRDLASSLIVALTQIRAKRMSISLSSGSASNESQMHIRAYFSESMRKASITNADVQAMTSGQHPQ